MARRPDGRPVRERTSALVGLDDQRAILIALLTVIHASPR